MRCLKRCKLAVVLLVFALAITSPAARSDLVPDFNAATPSINGCSYSYNVSITAGSQVNTGDYFTIYDFHGYVPGTAYAPADWVASEQFTGNTPFGVDIRAFYGDSATFVNLVFTYVGATSIQGSTLIGGAGAFGAETIQCQWGLGGFSSSVHIFSPGSPFDNFRKPAGGYTITPFQSGLAVLSLAPGTVPGKISAVATVKLDGPAPTGGAKVTLKSSNTAVATVPGSVTIAEGETSATFTVTTKAVASLTSVVISGAFEGVTKSATLKVRPIGVAKLTFNPTSVPGGSQSKGTVILEASAGPGDITVRLRPPPRPLRAPPWRAS
jgi:hypothetical protein